MEVFTWMKRSDMEDVDDLPVVVKGTKRRDGVLLILARSLPSFPRISLSNFLKEICWICCVCEGVHRRCGGDFIG